MSWIWGLLAAPVAAGAVYGAVAWSRHAGARERLFDAGVASAGARQRGLRRWLSRAGFRDPLAPLWFGIAMIAAVLGAAAIVVASSALGWQTSLALGSDLLPGPAGVLLSSILVAAPWIVGAAIAMAPWLVVRARRRQRVAAVEGDLPVTLELLATLSEAGVGFDSSVEDTPPVKSIMERDPLSIAPETPTQDAIDLMRHHRVSCLPVVSEGKLVGIVSERDFLPIAYDLLEQRLDA